MLTTVLFLKIMLILLLPWFSWNLVISHQIFWSLNNIAMRFCTIHFRPLVDFSICCSMRLVFYCKKLYIHSFCYNLLRAYCFLWALLTHFYIFNWFNVNTLVHLLPIWCLVLTSYWYWTCEVLIVCLFFFENDILWVGH